MSGILEKKNSIETNQHQKSNNGQHQFHLISKICQGHITIGIK